MAQQLKPGWKTTEFWLSLLAMVIGALEMSGAFGGNELANQIIGGGIAIMGKLGYTVPRASQKKKALEQPAEPELDDEPDEDELDG